MADEKSDKGFTLPPIEWPDEEYFRPHIKQEDLVDLGKRDQKLLLAFSVLEQKIELAVAKLIESSNRSGEVVSRLRKEQESMRQELEVIRAEQKTIGVGHSKLTWQAELWKWIVMVTGAGIIAGIINAIARKFF